MAISNPLLSRGGQLLLTRRGLPRMRPLPDARNREDLGAVVHVIPDQNGVYFVTLDLPVAVPGLIIVFRGEVEGTPTDVTFRVRNPQVGTTAIGSPEIVMGALYGQSPSYATAIVEDGKVGSPGTFTPLDITAPPTERALLTSVTVTGSGVVGAALGYAYTWTGYPAPSIVSVVWKKEGVEVSGADTFTPDGEVGESVTVTLTITNGVGEPHSLESEPIFLTAANEYVLFVSGDPEDFTAFTSNYEE